MKRQGACGSVCDLFAMPFSHRPDVTSGVMEEGMCRTAAGILHKFAREGEKLLQFFSQ